MTKDETDYKALYEQMCERCDALDRQLAVYSEAKGKPIAWINWSALTGERSLGWECESELASEPLYTAPSVATNDISQERVDETSKQRHEAQPEQEPKKIPESWATHGGLWIEALYKHQRGD